MKYFSISSVVEAYDKVSASTREKFWGILGVLHSIDKTVYPNKSYSVETGKLSQYFEDLFRMHEKREYSSTDEYSFVFSTHWVNVVSEDYLVGKPEIVPILIWSYRNHSFPNEISVPELFNIFLEDHHITKEVAEQLFKITFNEQLQFDDNQYSDSELLSLLGGSEASGNTTLKLNRTFVVANPGDLSRGPYFQPLYAALQTLKCLTIYPFNIHDFYDIESGEINKEHKGGIDGVFRQIIYYGAPGTGKSHKIMDDGNVRKSDEKNLVFRTTFHPDSDYSTFVGCYKPTTQGASQQTILDYDSLVDRFKKYISDFGNITHASAAIGYNYHDSIVRMQESGVHTIADLLADAHKSGTTYDTTIRSGMLLYEEQVQTGKSGDKITYAFVPQAFTNAYVKAWNTKDPVFLIIEEINRGNCAQIFGDLFQLLDRKNGVSEYPVDADSDLANYIGKELARSTRDDFPNGVKEGKKLVLPSNLYIWATMNTSDQSLFPIDSAFKRRWEWKYIPIKEHPDKKFLIEIGEKTYDWWGFLERINKVIGETTSSEDKKLGYFFVKTETSKVSDEQFVGKVLFYLWNDVFKNYGFDHTIFSKGDKDKFVFSDFFNADGTPNKDSVQQFLKRLEETIKIDRPLDVTPKEEPTTISEEATESEA